MWGMRLRAIRTERCKLAIGKAAELVGWHPSKLSRTERGQRKVTVGDFATCVTAWGLPVGHREEILAELAAGSTGWWERPIPGVHQDVGTLAAYEEQAREIVSVAFGAVPGLLQTRETAASIVSSTVPKADVETRWMARLQRQQILGRVKFAAFIAEQAIRTPWGGGDIWRDQLERLLKADEIGYGVRVVPQYQTEILLKSSWQWMRFPHTPPVVHVELDSGAVFVHEADRYTKIIERLEKVAFSRTESRILIRQLIEGA
ncbi:helix-turn-helix protein [Actinophytocola oryzae]|uniref:Helix-turn-helix protein n=2 Tax=Actinophytocola oryzae TaxID=502181 RepID=A0A4R7VZI0_9PSEU|nr:helix-turn-helix protein [Actinophytocola oryzae]